LNECLLGVCGGFSSILPDGNQWQTNVSVVNATAKSIGRRTNDERRRAREKGRWTQAGNADGSRTGSRLWLTLLDLIERRLFGFKNVNQIHLNLSTSLFTLPVFLLTFVLQLHGTRQIKKRGGRERRVVEGGDRRAGSSFYSLYFK